MKLLNTYEDKDEAEAAAKQITGEKRLASDREDNQVIYKLLGQPTWTNFHRLGMFNLPELKEIIDNKKSGLPFDQARHKEILNSLRYAANSFGIDIPSHWL